MTKRAAVEVEALSKSFKETTALDRVSFDVPESAFVTLVGPSGCGKSTTLRLLAGLSTPTSGRVTIDGVAVDGPVPNAAMVFQQPVLLPWRRTVENILFPAEMRGRPSKSDRERALDLVRLVGLEGFERAYPHELSGGMQQRVAICRALLLDPALLLMDEPFGALDVLTREKMALELQRIWETVRSTVVFVTHSVTEAVLLSDAVVVLSARPGRVEAVLQVDLARPRTIDTIAHPRFAEIAAEVRERLEVRWTE